MTDQKDDNTDGRQDDRRWPTDRRDPKSSSGDQPDMTRERARTERRDLDKERGEPVAGGATRGGPRALRPTARPLHDWSTRPKILVTNDDGVESRGLLAGCFIDVEDLVIAVDAVLRSGKSLDTHSITLAPRPPAAAAQE